jgi:2-dehydropantoate 2-reductase
MAEHETNPVPGYLIFGTGAIGTYIGGSLALLGERVVFLDRPETCQALTGKGLHLKLGEGTFRVPEPVLVDTPARALELGPFHAAIFAMKSFDTQGALDEIEPHKEVFPPVLCMQNGVENESRIAQCLGDGKIIPGTLTSAIRKDGPGAIVLEKLRGIGIALGHPLAKALAATFNQAGLNARLFGSAPAMKWSKMLTNLLANASSAILGMEPAKIYAHGELFRLEMAQLREALSVMEAMGITPVDLPGTAVRMLARATRFPNAVSRPLLQRAVGGGRGGKMPSFYIDLQAGRKQSEVDFLNGAVVRYGEKLGIPTPVNRLLNQTLLGMVNGDIRREDFQSQPDKLLRLWEKH